MTKTKKPPIEVAEGREQLIAAEILAGITPSIPKEWTKVSVDVRLGPQGRLGSGGVGLVDVTLARRNESKGLHFAWDERPLLAMAARRAASTGVRASLAERSEVWNDIPKAIGDVAVSLFTAAAIARLGEALRGEAA